MIGLPFANMGSLELQQKLAYQSSATSTPKNELYENMCMRAVNQSIGRSIRHKNDYACILLFDKRYGNNRIKEKLPGWIKHAGIEQYDGFGKGLLSVRNFFRKF